MDPQRQYADIMARAATDSNFRQALLANPAGTLLEAGVEVPEGMQIEVLEASPTKVYFIVPEKTLVDDELLARAAGGSTASSAATASTFLCISLPGSAGTVSSAGTAG